MPSEEYTEVRPEGQDAEMGGVPAAQDEDESEDECGRAVDDDDDNEDGAPATAQPTLTKLGAWKTNLAKLKRDTLPEDALHLVNWADVARRFVSTLAAFGVFIGFVFVSHFGVVLSLPVYLICLGLATILCEYIMSLHVRFIVIISAMVVAICVGGAWRMGPYEFFQLVSHTMIVILGVLVLCLWLKDRSHDTGGRLHRTEVWRTLCGRKYVKIVEETEFAAFLKSLTHTKLAPAKTALGKRIRAWMGLSDNAIMVELVRVDEKNADVPDVQLCLDGEDFDPNVYMVTGIRIEDPATNTDCALPIINLEQTMIKRKCISDNVLDSWINPEKRPKEPNGQTDVAQEIDLKPGPEVQVRDFMWQAKLAPNGQAVVYVELSRLDYLDGLVSHWFPRVVYCVIVCSTLIMPTAQLLMQTDEYRRQICFPSGSHPGNGTRSIYGEVVCDSGSSGSAASCDAICKNYMSFLHAMHDVFHTSYIELTIVLIMLPTYIFTSCVHAAKAEHNRQEILFLSRMRESKRAVQEVLRYKRSLEDVISVRFLISRCLDCFAAWRGADTNLTACGLISEAEFDLTSQRSANDCLKEVMLPVSSLKAGIACEKSDALAYGLGYPAGDSDDSTRRKKTVIEAWDLLKLRNSLGGAHDRNYKVLFDVLMYTNASWDYFVTWVNANYQEQFDFIISNIGLDAQDSGANCHLKKNCLIHDIMIPRGFSLTHIYVQAMPDDGKPVQIDLRGYRRGAKGFWDGCRNIVQSIKTAQVDHEGYDPDEHGDRLDFRLDRSPIIARFALSEQYWNNMSFEERENLCPSATKSSTFTNFVDGLLAPEAFEIPPNPDDRRLWFYTGISVFMGDMEPFSAFLAALRSVVQAVSVYTLCLALAMLVPVMRLLSGGQMFPRPFLLWLAANTLCIWFLLFSFYGDFHAARARLGIISECLTILYDKTIAPPSTQASPATGQDEKEKQAAAELEKKKQSENTQPFELVVSSALECYDPTSPECIQEWRKKHDNVSNWHATVSYLRIFVSTSRLTAQTMLVASAAVLLVLIAMSVAQTSLGSEVLDSATATAQGVQARTADMLTAAVDAGKAASRRLEEHRGEALTAVAVERAASWATRRLGLATGARSSIEQEEEEEGADLDHYDWVATDEASRALRSALLPARAALHGALLAQGRAVLDGHRELRGLARLSPGMRAVVSTLRAARARRLEGKDGKEGEANEPTPLDALMEKAQKAQHVLAAMSLAKATKTQVFTLTMVIFVLLFSVPLMWNIILVNGHFDLHDDLLLKQKEVHRSLQSRRDIKKKKEGDAPTAGGEAPAAGQAQEGSTEQPAAPVGETPPSPQRGQPDDPELARYERRLEVAVEVAKKSRERFPLKMFGFVISFHLLASWIAVAGGSLVKNAVQLAPPVFMVACAWLEHSQMVQQLQEEIPLSYHLNITTLLHEDFCVPVGNLLTEYLEEHGDEAEEKVHASLTEKVTGTEKTAESEAPKVRRLFVMPASGLGQHLAPDRVAGDSAAPPWREVYVPDLRHLVLRWWRARPAVDSREKYRIARHLLNDLSREGDRLLVSQPEAVLLAFEEKSLARGGRDSAAAYLNAKGAVQTLMRQALRDLEAEEAAAAPEGPAEAIWRVGRGAEL